MITFIESHGLVLSRHPDGRKGIPVDNRHLSLLLQASKDPQVSLGQFSTGVRVGPGVRLPSLPALRRRKIEWRLLAQSDPTDYLGEGIIGDPRVQRNYASIKSTPRKCSTFSTTTAVEARS